ncbi:hypothetical protein DRH14_03980, partial [Candidatus Shapirobacteria bacterium]
MASTLKIIISIVEKGFETFGSLAQNLDKIKESLGAIEATPTAGLEGHIKKIDENVEKIEERFSKIINKIVKQTVHGLSSTTDKLSKETDAFFEKTYTAAALSLAGIAVFGVEKIFEALFDVQTGVLSTSQLILNVFTKTLSKIYNSGILKFLNFLQVRFLSLSKSIVEISVNLGSFVPIFGSFTGLFLKFTLGAASLSFVSVLFNEWRLLFNRLVGDGIYGLKPLERATRLLHTIDTAVHSIGLTAGQVFKTTALGIATFMGPFSGFIAGIPFVNSIITSALRAGTRLRDSFLASLGSGKAQFNLFIFDIKNLILKT